MKLQDVPAGQGVVWVRQAFRVFLRQPLGFTALFAACFFVFVLLRLIPLVGSLAILVCAPVGSLVFMVATRRVAAGQPAMPGSFAEIAGAGRPRLLGLLKLGLAYLVAAVVIYLVSAAIDGGALAAFFDSMRDGKQTPEQAATRLADPRLQGGVLVWLLLVGLLSVPFWHAPALVFWAGQGWAKSLFSSTVAVWRNRGAFMMYGLAWAAVGLAVVVASGLVVALLGPQLFAFVGTPLMLVLSTVFYASLWFTFADCFAAASPLQETS